MRSSFRQIRFASATVILLVVIASFTGCGPPMTPDNVNYAYKNYFYGGSQLSPNTEGDALVSCIKASNEAGKTGYLCRHLYNTNFTRTDYLVPKAGVRGTFRPSGTHPYGTMVSSNPVAGLSQKGGPTDHFEGCSDMGSYYSCDYRADWHAFYELNGRGYSYMELFWNWGSVVTSQATCTAGVSAIWAGGAIGWAGWVGVIRDCGTYPYQGGDPWSAQG